MSEPLSMLYRNHAGVTSWRRVLPGATWHGVSASHEGEQWFLAAHCLGRDAARDFALADVLSLGADPLALAAALLAYERDRPRGEALPPFTQMSLARIAGEAEALAKSLRQIGEARGG